MSILTTNDYHEKLDINHFPSGIYYIKITGKGKSHENIDKAIEQR
jgi:hypothetical protein